MSEELRLTSIQMVGVGGLNATIVLVGLAADGRAYFKNYMSHPWEPMNMHIEEVQP